MAKKDESKIGSDEVIWESKRGTVHFRGLDDGDEVVLRFRSHEIAMLEAKRGKGIMSLLNEESLGIGFLRDALLVGSAHMFIGRNKRKLSDSVVSSWIDRCEDNGVPFEDLLQNVVRAVVGGLPGGDKYLGAMDDDGDEKDDGGRPPSAPAA